MSQLKTDVEWLRSLNEKDFDDLCDLMEWGNLPDRLANALHAWRDGEGPYE
jgi:hypothetical protein